MRLGVFIGLLVLALTACTLSAPDAPSEPLGPYVYFAQKYVLNDPNVRLDANGIPEQYYAYDDIGWVRNPLTVARWGLTEHARFVSQRKPSQEAIFLQAAEWLVENQTEAGAWEYHFDWPVGPYTLSAPWISGIAQGQGIALLARAFEHTGDQKFLRAAARALGPMMVRDVEGGLIGEFQGVGNIIEEYPGPNGSTHVLNGWAFALIGLHDLYVATGNAQAHGLFTASEASLRNLLHRYSIGEGEELWSLYDLKHLVWNYAPHEVSAFYMNMHVSLLRKLYEITGLTTYAVTADAWAQAETTRGEDPTNSSRTAGPLGAPVAIQPHY